MPLKIDVYLKSVSIARDLGEFRHAGQHTYCAPSMMDGVRGTRGFRGRLLTPESDELLAEINSIGETWQERITVYDVGRFRGLLKALIGGIWKTPCVVVDDEKFVGLSAARKALRTMTHL